MLAAELSQVAGSGLSQDAKIRLLQFRVGNNISNNLHINFLEYEVSEEPIQCCSDYYMDRKIYDAVGDSDINRSQLIIRNYHTDEQLGSKSAATSTATPAVGATSIGIPGKIHSIIRSFFFF